MTVSQLDAKAALIVVDLQKGIAAMKVAGFDAVAANNARLVKAFRAKGQAVVLVNAAGGAPGRTDEKRPPFNPPPEFLEIIPELGPEPGDHRVTKRTWGAFHNTDLAAFLKSASVTQVFVTGVATSIGVESTARQAYEHGYHVVLVTDAMADLDADRHHNSIDRLFPRLGERGTTDEVLALLGR